MRYAPIENVDASVSKKNSLVKPGNRRIDVATSARLRFSKDVVYSSVQVKLSLHTSCESGPAIDA